MQFHSTEIPDGLVSAALSGHLVVFAGAGVSMQDPVHLPSFDCLIEQIKGAVDPYDQLRSRQYQMSQDGERKVYSETPEQYLSYLNREAGFVREECCAVLSSRGRTNALHRELLRLFPDAIPPKIVTTNFDDCFEVAFDEAEESCEAYSAPALPYGDGFRGLIHLHGSTRMPESMVLFAEDYGKAYVTNGWASRFLVDLFEEYAVLFVGYSCGDSLVDYLTRSISNRITGNAYSLCKAGEDSSDWSMRGVTPISFKEYEDLPLIIKEWADFLEQSVTDRVRQLRKIACHAELDDNDVEYLLSSLTWSDGDDRVVFTHEFCSASTSFDHLKMLNKYGKTTFLTCSDPDDAELELLRWTISNFSIEYCTELREMCISVSGDPSPCFFGELIRYLVLSDAPLEVVGAWIAWMELMPTRYHSHCSYFLLELANKCESSEIALAIIRMLLHVSLSVSEGMLSNVRHEVVVAVDDEFYKDKIIGCLTKYKKAIGDRVFEYCFQQIETAYSVQTDSWTNPNAFDSLSYTRSSVGPHSQDQYARGAGNVLLDMARESVMPESADEAIRKCLDSRCSMLIRLGLWLVSEYRCTGEALRLLQEGDYLSNIYLHHEVFQLIRCSFAVATDVQKDAFADYLKLHFASREDCDYECYNICNWILETSDCRKVVQMRDEILRANPNYLPREHPDFTYYMSVGSVDPSSDCKINRNLFTIEEMIRRLSRPAKPGSFITGFDIVSTPCKEYPKEAFEMIRELLVRERTEEETLLCGLLVRTIDWRSACIAVHDAGRLLADVCAQPDLCVEGVNAVRSLTMFADKQVEWGEYDFANILLAASKNVDKYLMEPPTVGFHGDTDWLQVGINHPAGKYLQLIAALDRATYKESECHSEVAKRLLLELDPIRLEESVGSKSLIACYFQDFNLWSDVDERYAQNTAALLIDGGWSLIPAWQGMARLRRLSSIAWRLTRESWKRLFSGAIDVGQERLNELACLYVWIAIVHTDNGSEKSQMLDLLGSGTRQTFEAACHQVDNWLETLDEGGRLAAWNSWLSESFRFVASRMPDGGEVLASIYCRWLRVFPALRPSIADALMRDCAHIKDRDLFVHEGTLTDIALDGSLDPSSTAATIAFLLEHQRFFAYEGDAREAAKGIDLEALSSNERRQLEDAYTRRGMFDVFEGR